MPAAADAAPEVSKLNSVAVHDGDVGLKRDLGAGLFSGFSGLRQGAFGNAALVVLFPGGALSRQISRCSVSLERIYATHADAVQAAGYFVGI